MLPKLSHINNSHDVEVGQISPRKPTPITTLISFRSKTLKSAEPKYEPKSPTTRRSLSPSKKSTGKANEVRKEVNFCFFCSFEF